MESVAVVPCPREKSRVIKNLYPLYEYDLSEFEALRFNEHGVLGSRESESWDSRSGKLDLWWEDEGQRFPFLIYRGEEPVGFCLVCRPAEPDEGIDNYLVEFFVVKSARGRGIGRRAASEIIGRFDGRWTLRVLPGNSAAARFWAATIEGMGEGLERREYVDEDAMNCVDFMFRKRGGA